MMKKSIASCFQMLFVGITYVIDAPPDYTVGNIPGRIHVQ
jgi:hypothetical protein